MSGDYDFDRAYGLPEDLPQDERLLWQGHPDWINHSIHAFHVRKVMIYFVALAALQGVGRMADGASVAMALQPLLWFVPMGLLATLLLLGLAWLSARTTTYTLTSKRAVLKIGMALPVTFNVPFKQIDGAAITHTGGGAGDLYFRFGGKDRIAYLMLWPHARRWHFAKPEAAFRSIPDLDRVAQLAAAALNVAPTSANVDYGLPSMMAAE